MPRLPRSVRRRPPLPTALARAIWHRRLRVPEDVDGWRGEGLERDQAQRAAQLHPDDAAAFLTWLRKEGWRRADLHRPQAP